MSGIPAHSVLRERTQNNILAGLPPEAYERLAPDLELIPLKPGAILYEDEARARNVYFPVDGVITLLCGSDEGHSAEIALVGSEGLAGIAAFIGGPPASSKAVVQSGGAAYRLSSTALKREFELASSLRDALLRYTRALIKMMVQTTLCNRRHTAEQQLCRWLLSSMDRLPSNEVLMTPELIASMPGLRREGIAEAAKKMHAEGAIDFRCDRIEVLDRLRLETRACECYAATRAEFERFLRLQRPQPDSGRIRIHDMNHARRLAPWHVAGTRDLHWNTGNFPGRPSSLS